MKLECGTKKCRNNIVTAQDKVTSGGKDRRMRENDGGGEKGGFERQY
jgi:hypothetical protein